MRVLVRMFVMTAVAMAAIQGGGAQAGPLKLSVSSEIRPDDLNGRLAKNIRCIRDTIYTEARGEPAYAQALVGYVVVARWKDGRWGKTPCDVAYRLDVRGGALVSQFSGNTHHPVSVPEDDPKLMAIARIAVHVYLGYFVPEQAHRCVRAYQRREHASNSRQDWFATLRQAGKVGHHMFYCLPESKTLVASR